MQMFDNPSVNEWRALCVRPIDKKQEVEAVVANVFKEVKQGGDKAVKALSERYDGRAFDCFVVDIGSAKQERRALTPKLADAIDAAYVSIRDFHLKQAESNSTSVIVERIPGVKCWRESRPIRKVGLYVPGGTAPLVSTMLMLGVPAQIAGCPEVFVCTPPAQDGSVNAAIRYAAAKCGVSRLFRVGGAQAIAAMSIGTDTIACVDKLFGPGNQYVTAAKEMAQRYGVAIDMPAGPSEIMVVADADARTDFVAADLLSQAEHGPDSQVMLVTTSKKLQQEVEKELQLQVRVLPRAQIARRALRNSRSIVFTTPESCVAFTNRYAPEHLILQVRDPAVIATRVNTAGSVFLGQYSPESAGDYASGPNHTLPTNGWARSYSGLSVCDFQRQISFQHLSESGLQALAPTIITLANAEGLTAHARAVSIRRQSSIMGAI